MGSHLSVAAEPRFFEGASVQSRALGLGIRHGIRPLLSAWARLPVTIWPPNVLDLIARALPVPADTKWRLVDLDGTPAEWVHGPGVETDNNNGAILYFHGGAFLTCGLNTHRRMVSRISAAADRPVFNVAYRQMPKEPIAESIADGVRGFEYLLAQGYEPGDITVAGDSAGGYLAFAVARAVLDASLGRPAGVVAMSPLLDFDATRKREHPNAHTCQAFPMRAVEKLSDLAEALDIRHGIQGNRTCPVNMPLADMPPALIHIGSREVLMADAEHMANRLTSAGVPCELHVWDRQVHVFHAAASWVPEGRAAIEEIGTFIRQLDTQTLRASHPTSRPAARATTSINALG